MAVARRVDNITIMTELLYPLIELFQGQQRSAFYVPISAYLYQFILILIKRETVNLV